MTVWFQSRIWRSLIKLLLNFLLHTSFKLYSCGPIDRKWSCSFSNSWPILHFTSFHSNLFTPFDGFRKLPYCSWSKYHIYLNVMINNCDVKNLLCKFTWFAWHEHISRLSKAWLFVIFAVWDTSLSRHVMFLLKCCLLDEYI